MRTYRVYVDTSVFGGTQDEQFANASKRFFERVTRGEFTVLLSRTTVDELATAPENVRKALDDLPPGRIEGVVVNAEAQELANRYVASGVLGEASLGDALHVAVASVAGADVILSWNFRHIVNFDRIRGFNGVNTAMGYRTLAILSPLEMGYGDEE